MFLKQTMFEKIMTSDFELQIEVIISDWYKQKLNSPDTFWCTPSIPYFIRIHIPDKFGINSATLSYAPIQSTHTHKMLHVEPHA
jgi:hypothetical protein